MNYAEIEGFLAIVQNGSMTRAAQKLFITQPTLSNRIHALEEELGGKFGSQMRASSLSPSRKNGRIYGKRAGISAPGRRESLSISRPFPASTCILCRAFISSLWSRPSLAISR